MKLRNFLPFLLASMFSLGACSGGVEPIDFDKIDANEYTPSKITGVPSEFSLISPTNGIETYEVPSFSWNPSTNAASYTLEICESEAFVPNVDTIAYYIQTNITSTSYTIQSLLGSKNVTYYWRVFAINGKESVQSNETFTFVLKAEDVDEVKFDLGEADDWQLHQAGSHADISIDENNFFGNNDKSLLVTFKKEDTSQGIPSSDGWVIVTKTVEKSCYGTDALYMNVYYSGHDADLLIRLVDKDNEYWFAKIEISNNAKQTAIIKFDSFVLHGYSTGRRYGGYHLHNLRKE